MLLAATTLSEKNKTKNFGLSMALQADARELRCIIINFDAGTVKLTLTVFIKPWVATQKRVAIHFDWIADDCIYVKIKLFLM